MDHFDDHVFLSLSGQELAKYAEGYLTLRPAQLSEDSMEHFRSILDNVDIEHAVYAIQLCMQNSPEKFLGDALRLLSNRDASVACSAFDSIRRNCSRDILCKNRDAISRTPTVRLFSEIPGRGVSVDVGSNRQFIDDLLAICDLR